ncbi:hypothetical protein [Rhodoferax sp.]|uniref:hypothetical protein n=1 Tax=Rhodoferax sp. TaxID=50421 RepID=UPI0025ED5D26|nr:hypothetical protein [Rhodoferax sp.]
MRFLLFTALLAALAPAADAGVFTTRCLVAEGGKKPVQLQFSTVGDDTSGWSGGFVRYGSHSRPISLVRLRESHVETAPGRPFAFTTVWLEMVGGQAAGSYEVETQGARIQRFVYTPKRSSLGTTSFMENPAIDVGDDGACRWTATG